VHSIGFKAFEKRRRLVFLSAALLSLIGICLQIAAVSAASTVNADVINCAWTVGTVRALCSMS
jgi:hypothetical protein